MEKTRGCGRYCFDIWNQTEEIPCAEVESAGSDGGRQRLDVVAEWYTMQGDNIAFVRRPASMIGVCLATTVHGPSTAPNVPQ